VFQKGWRELIGRHSLFKTAKSLESPPFPFAKPSQIVPSISLKTKGNFGRKEPFQNL